MKQNIKTWMLTAALMATGVAAQAQNFEQNEGNRPSPEEMMEKRGSSIAQQLGLDKKATKKFLSVYKKQQTEMMQLMPRGGMPPRGERPQGERPDMKKEGMKRDSIGRRPMGRPQMSEADKQKMNEVKAKYDKEYAKFLTQDQLTQLGKLQQRGGGRRHGRGFNRQ